MRKKDFCQWPHGSRTGIFLRESNGTNDFTSSGGWFQKAGKSRLCNLSGVLHFFSVPPILCKYSYDFVSLLSRIFFLPSFFFLLFFPIFFCLSFCQSFYPSVCLPICLSANLSIDADLAVVNHWTENVLPSILENYSEDVIYNADEMGLFYHMQPDRTLHFIYCPLDIVYCPWPIADIHCSLPIYCHFCCSHNLFVIRCALSSCGYLVIICLVMVKKSQIGNTGIRHNRKNTVRPLRSVIAGFHCT